MRALAIAPNPTELALIVGKLGASAWREKYMVTFWVFQSIKFSTSTGLLLWKCKKHRFLSLNLNFLTYLIMLIFPPSWLITPRRAECNPVTSLTFRHEWAAATISMLQKMLLGFDANQTSTPCWQEGRYKTPIGGTASAPHTMYPHTS